MVGGIKAEITGRSLWRTTTLYQKRWWGRGSGRGARTGAWRAVSARGAATLIHQVRWGPDVFSFEEDVREREREGVEENRYGTL